MFERYTQHPDAEPSRSILFGKPIPEAKGSISKEDRRAMAERMAKRVEDMQDQPAEFADELETWDGDLSELDPPSEGGEK